MTEPHGLGWRANHLGDGVERPAVALVDGTGLCRDCAVEELLRQREIADHVDEQMSAIQARADALRPPGLPGR